MERLTERNTKMQALCKKCGENCENEFMCKCEHFQECPDMDAIIDKLAVYEETGLEHEEVVKMQNEIDRLRNTLKEKCDYINKISSQIHVETGF